MAQSRNLLLIIDAHAHDTMRTMRIVIMIHTDDYNDDDWGEDDGSYSASRNWARQMILALCTLCTLKNTASTLMFNILQCKNCCILFNRLIN